MRGYAPNGAMKSNKHYTIPVFIPFAGCPFKCVFCDQNRITSRDGLPSPGDIVRIAETYLGTLPVDGAEIEIGFFGGTFTGLPIELQKKYLDTARTLIENTAISSIRLSTRPDRIDKQVIGLLRNYPVGTIELGVQSLDDHVLQLSGRGHTALDTLNASRLIKEAGFRLGHQIMIGLPGDTRETSMKTASDSAAMRPDDVRLYPVLVIEGTRLAEDYHAGRYSPLPLDDAVRIAADIIPLYEQAGAKIIRAGLHPSEELTSDGKLLAGPYHPSFKELVMTELWRREFESLPGDRLKHLKLTVPSHEINAAAGYRGQNKKLLIGKYRAVSFRGSDSLDGRRYDAVLD